MKTLLAKNILGVVLAGLVFATISIGSCELRKRRLESAFAQVEIGNSKQQVVALLGEPGEIGVCNNDMMCTDRYYYHSFMERWIVYFDKEGNVIDTGYNVSF